jgi:hypothetical protein
MPLAPGVNAGQRVMATWWESAHLVSSQSSCKVVFFGKWIHQVLWRRDGRRLMIQPISTVAFWGGDLSDAELEELSGFFGKPFSDVDRQKVVALYHSYVSSCAVSDHAHPAKTLRKRLKDLAASARKTADLLGAEASYFDELLSHRPPKNGVPYDNFANETNHRVEIEMIHFDIEFRRQSGFDPKFGEIPMVQMSWQLAQISRGAEHAAKKLVQSGGRPATGAKRLVEGLINLSIAMEAKLTCSYSDAEGVYKGRFLTVAAWLRKRPQPVREAESTLCKLAVRALATHGAQI